MKKKQIVISLLVVGCILCLLSVCCGEKVQLQPTRILVIGGPHDDIVYEIAADGTIDGYVCNTGGEITEEDFINLVYATESKRLSNRKRNLVGELIDNVIVYPSNIENMRVLDDNRDIFILVDDKVYWSDANKFFDAEKSPNKEAVKLLETVEELCPLPTPPPNGW